MNWKEISEKYPKAFNKSQNERTTIVISPLRDLYDFFDEQGIYGWVSPEIQHTRMISENPHYCVDEWGYDIQDDSFELAVGSGFESRPKAEAVMFEKEFEILEEKLK